jgi:subtilisin-like proprotein convertase family protein
MSKKGAGAVSLIVLLVASSLATADNPPAEGAVILSNTPKDYDWWNGCSPTAAGMLFGWWEEAGYDAFPGSHRILPDSYGPTSSDPADYQDARGVIAGWAHKQEGINQGLDYGHYANHAPDSLADFMLTADGGTNRSNMPHGFETFGAWDDRRTSEIESRRFTANNVFTSSGWTYDDYCSEIDAGRPVHLGLTSTAGGHSVLGVGYNDTGGKENIILHTTWGLGLQEWEWDEEQHSGYEFSVYGATLMDAVTDPTPHLSAYLSLAHTYIADLTVVVGVGDPDDPDWSITVWDNEGNFNDYDNNLVLTDIDCTAVLSDFLAGDLDWFLKVEDDANGDEGAILDFQIRYGFDEDVVFYEGGPVAIYDRDTSYAYLDTVPEPSTICLLILGGSALLARRHRKRS